MDDATFESDETFGVELVPRNDVTFGVPSIVILTIIDDDGKKFVISLVIRYITFVTIEITEPTIHMSIFNKSKQFIIGPVGASQFIYLNIQLIKNGYFV